jgi:hypothetical protein
MKIQNMLVDGKFGREFVRMGTTYVDGIAYLVRHVIDEETSTSIESIHECPLLSYRSSITRTMFELLWPFASIYYKKAYENFTREVEWYQAVFQDR